MNVEPDVDEFRKALEGNASTYGVALTPASIAGLTNYYQLLTAWNSQLHLVAPTSASDFATRHVLESLVLLEHLPVGARVADIGSGGGLPIVPCLVVRPDLEAVLIEASLKKTVFLRETLREVLLQDPSSERPARARVMAQRFEDVSAPSVDFITCRALERFEETIPKLVEWAPEDTSFLLFGGEGLGKTIEEAGWVPRPVLLPNSERRYLFIGTRASRRQRIIRSEEL